MVLAGTQCSAVSWQLLFPEFQWIQHKPQHYLLEGFPAPKPLDFQHI